MDADMKIDAATVRRLREAQAWSQEQLAAVAGVSVRTVQRVEAESHASMETCMALAIAFGCLPADLAPPAAIAPEDVPSGLEATLAMSASVRRNAAMFMIAFVLMWVGILLGNALLGPSSSVFGVPVYDGFVLGLTAMLFVSVMTLPGAAQWASERWRWPCRGCRREAAL